MNVQKINSGNNNGWILCPSKSFPGKFYYFNVMSGEAVWCLNDNEKTSPMKENRNNIEKIHNFGHRYPEPSSPPENFQVAPTNVWTNTPKSSFPPNGQIPFQNSSFTQNTPMFCQPAKFVSNMEHLNMPVANLAWIPIQFPMPTWPYMASDTKKATKDRVTQTSRIERDIYVEASGTPLCQRFINYEIPTLSFNKENKIINQPNKYIKKKSNSEMEFSHNQVPVSKFIPDSITNMERECYGMKSTENFQKCIEKCSCHGLHKAEIQMRNSRDPPDYIEFSKEKTPLCRSNRVVISKPAMKFEEPGKKDISRLDKSDLRFFLLAKRRQSQERLPDPVERKKTKFHEPSTSPKKKVTFDTNIMNIADSSSSNENYECMPYTSTISDVSSNNIISPLIEEREKTVNDVMNKHKMYNMSINNMGNVNMPTTENNLRIPSKNNRKMKENTTKNIKLTMEEEAHNFVTMRNMQKNIMPNEYTVSSSAKDITKENDRIGNVPMKVNMADSIKDVWYIVVDMDILLDDHMFVEQLLKSDGKYKLLIPHALRTEIESLCIGDCRGQQRVLVARQISRRMTVAHKQYVVDETPDDENGVITTTESILNCCVRAVNDKKYLVLITNDPHLLTRANALNIRCYKPQEIKNGAIVNPKLFSELKKIKVTVDNDGTYEDIFFQNKPDDVFCDKRDYPFDICKKRLFANEEKNKDCDFLINITKTKSNNNDVKHDTPIDISKRIQKLDMKDSRKIEFNNNYFPHNHLQDENAANLPNSTEISQNVKHCNESKKANNVHTDPNTTFTIVKNDDTKSIKNIFESIPNVNMHFTASTVNIHDTNLDVPNNDKNNGVNIITTVSKYRVKKIINALNPKSSKINQNEPKTNEIFKNPNLIPLKTGTNITSALKDGSSATDSIRSNFKNPRLSLEDRLKKFCVKNKVMHVKIRSRMDEWICTYTQIMEGLLNDILRKNPEYNMTKTSTSASNLHESLTCLKMLYDNSELRDLVDGMMELLAKCTCGKGKLKMDTTPKDFMKIIGCGVLLVQTLKSILPSDDILTDYTFYCDSLLSNIESQSTEFDPELLRHPVPSRSEVEDDSVGTRLIYRKEPTVVLDYLKKNFKEWSNYDVNQNGASNQHIKKQEEFKVVRMFGKNVNLLKIGNNKCISYAEATEECPRNNNGTKLVRLEQNQTISQINNENKDIEKINNENQNKIDKTTNNDINHEIINLDSDAETYHVQELHFPESNEKAEPKIIRNINLIDAYEDKINKEPLDLDLLDFNENITNESENSKENYKTNDNFHENDNVFNTRFFNKTNEIIQDTHNYASDNDFYASRKTDQNVITIEDINPESNNDDCVNKPETYGRNNDIAVDSNMNNLSENYGKEEPGENYATSNRNYAVHNENAEIVRAGSPNDSGFENESTQAHILVKMFLIELSSTFKIIYEFATNFMKELRKEIMCEERKNFLHIKASRCLQEMVGIIQQLRSIIKRESHEDTVLKNLLLRAGVEATSDKKVTRYRQIIRKCLEQAQILESALRIIICITIGDLDAVSTYADSISSSIRYINIFE